MALRRLWVFLIGMVLLAEGSGDATTMRHHPLAELVQEAERIFVGVCVSVGDGTLSQSGGGGIPYTEYTFEVRDALKGSPGKSLTIRQYGVRAPRPAPDGTRALVTRARGMPVYQPGQELLLFLIGDRGKGGQSVPVLTTRPQVV